MREDKPMIVKVLALILAVGLGGVAMLKAQGCKQEPAATPEATVVESAPPTSSVDQGASAAPEMTPDAGSDLGEESASDEPMNLQLDPELFPATKSGMPFRRTTNQKLLDVNLDAPGR